MRWKKAQTGDRRIIKTFALIPIEIKNEVRWLETCYIKQEYSYLFDWENRAFVEKDDYEKFLQGVKNQNHGK